MRKQILNRALRLSGFGLLLAAGLFFATSLKAGPPPSWTQLSENDSDLDFYYSIETCGSATVIFIKVENAGSASREVNYTIEVSEANSSTSETFTQTVEVDANGSKSGSCTLIAPPELFLKLTNSYSSPAVTLSL